MTTPYLSICVPSRNRQRYFKELILSLLASPRADVQFVLADNSDDAEDMAAFVAARPDPRVTFLRSADRVLSMQENWERAVDAALGDWVSVIGDDDQIDPDLVEALKLAEALKPGLDAFAWTNLHYGWRTRETPRHTVRAAARQGDVSRHARLVRASARLRLGRRLRHHRQRLFDLSRGAVAAAAQSHPQTVRRCLVRPSDRRLRRGAEDGGRGRGLRLLHAALLHFRRLSRGQFGGALRPHETARGA
ncbi:glycosyltransferase family 2 protein [Rhizobium sp. G21]|nr:glycosyltransferase family 2 protein [Rhizobium sp. G21]